MANQSDESGIVKSGLLIDFEHDSQKETDMVKHSMPIGNDSMLSRWDSRVDGFDFRAQDNGAWSWKAE